MQNNDPLSQPNPEPADTSDGLFSYIGKTDEELYRAEQAQSLLGPTPDQVRDHREAEALRWSELTRFAEMTGIPYDREAVAKHGDERFWKFTTSRMDTTVQDADKQYTGGTWYNPFSWLEGTRQGGAYNVQKRVRFDEQTQAGELTDQQRNVREGLLARSDIGYSYAAAMQSMGRTGWMEPLLNPDGTPVLDKDGKPIRINHPSWAPMSQEGVEFAQVEGYWNREKDNQGQFTGLAGQQLYGAIGYVFSLGNTNNWAKMTEEAIFAGVYEGRTLQDPITGEVWDWDETDNELRVSVYSKHSANNQFLVRRFEALGGNIEDLEGNDPGAWQTDLIERSNALATFNYNADWKNRANEDFFTWAGMYTGYFGQMLVSEVIGDPDEVFITAGTLGAGTVARLAAGTATLGARAAFAGSQGVAGFGTKIAAGRAIAGGLTTVGKGLHRTSEFISTYSKFTNFSEMGGVIGQSMLAKDAHIGLKLGAHIFGQSVDGMVQGAGFYGANQQKLTELAYFMYGHDKGNVATSAGYIESALIGAALSVGIGGAAHMGPVSLKGEFKWSRANLAARMANFDESYGYSGPKLFTLRHDVREYNKGEKELLKFIYGSEDNIPAGTRAVEAIHTSIRDISWAIATMTGADQNPHTAIRNSKIPAFAGESGVPLASVRDMLIELAGETDGRTLSRAEIDLKVREFIDENRTIEQGSGLSAEALDAKSDVLLDSILVDAEEAGVSDPRIDTSLSPEEQNNQRRALHKERLNRQRKRTAERKKTKDEKAKDLAAVRKDDPGIKPFSKEDLDKSPRKGGKTVAQLRRIAKALGIKGIHSKKKPMNRAALVKAILKAQKTEKNVTARQDAKAEREAAYDKHEAALEDVATEIAQEEALLNQTEADIDAGKLDDKNYTPAYDGTLEGKKRYVKKLADRLDPLIEAVEGQDTIKTETLRALVSKTTPEALEEGGPETVTGKEAAKILKDEKAAILETGEKLTEEDLALAAAVEQEGSSWQKVREAIDSSEAAAVAAQAGDRPAQMGDPSTYRAVRVRSTQEGIAETLQQRKKAKEEGRTWSIAEDVSGMLVAKARLATKNVTLDSGVQYLTYDAVKALFKDTALADIDIDLVFKLAKRDNNHGRKSSFDSNLLIHEMDTRVASVDPAFRESLVEGRKDEASNNPYVLERRVFLSLAAHQAIQAKAKFAANDGKLLGAVSEKEWVAKARSEFNNRMGSKKKNKGNSFEAVLERFELKAEEFANGTIDFLDPATFAEGLADIATGVPEGTAFHMETVEVQDADGMSYDKTRNSSFPSRRNAAMPYSARQWVNRWEGAVAFHRRRSIIDWDPSTGMTRAEVKAAIKAGLNPGHAIGLHHAHSFGGRLVPSELFTNPDKQLMTIDEAIIQAQHEMIEMDTNAYNMIHDDYGTLAGMWGIPANYEPGRWFEDVGAAGGFPLATILPSPDGKRSMGQAVLDAHTLLFPDGMWKKRAAAMARGDVAQAAGIDAYMGENIDGAQNGVRHALAYAYSDRPEVQDMIGAVDTDKDFYVSLHQETKEELKKQAAAGNAHAKWWLEQPEFTDDKVGRKFAKPPVMTKPYGAGFKSLFGHTESTIRDREATVNKSEAAQYLARMWNGNEKKKIKGLIDKALGLPTKDIFLAKLTKKVVEGEYLPDLDSPAAILQEAQRLAEDTDISADLWLVSLQLSAQAKAMGLTDARVQEIWGREMNDLATPKGLMQYRQMQAAGKFTLFEQVMGVLNRSAYELEMGGNAKFTRDVTGQEVRSLDERLPAEANGQFYWRNVQDWRTRMYVSSAILNPKGEKAGRHALDLEGLHESEGFTLKEGKTEEDYQVWVGKYRRGEVGIDSISDVVIWQGLGGQFSLAHKKQSKRKSLEEQHGKDTPEFHKALQEEMDRIETLVLKQVMLDAHGDFVPPMLEQDLTAGEFVQLDNAIGAESASRQETILQDFNLLTPEQREAFVAQQGIPRADARRSDPMTREEFEALPLELRRSISQAQGLHSLDTDMHHNPRSGIIGIPGLAVAAKAHSERATVATAQGKDTQTRREAADTGEALQALPVRENMVDTDERLVVDHTESALLPSLESNDGADMNLTPEQEEAVFKHSLTQYAEGKGLTKELLGQEWGSIWTHRHISRQIDSLSVSFKRRAKGLNKERRALLVKEYTKKFEEWKKELLSPSADITSGTMDTLTVDPNGTIKFVPGVDKDGNRLTMAQQLELSDRQGANVEAIAGQTSPMGLREQPVQGPMREGDATVPRFEDTALGPDAPEHAKPPEGREENPRASVHVVHSTDADAAHLTVATREEMDPRDALSEATIITSVEELEAGLSLGLIQGAEATTRVFTKTGVQVVMPRITGKNARRALSRNERYYALQNTKNKFLASRLDLAAKLELESLEVQGRTPLSQKLDAERRDLVLAAEMKKQNRELSVLARMGDPLVTGRGTYDSLSGSLVPNFRNTSDTINTYFDFESKQGFVSIADIAFSSFQGRVDEMGFTIDLNAQDFLLSEKSKLFGSQQGYRGMHRPASVKYSLVQNKIKKARAEHISKYPDKATRPRFYSGDVTVTWEEVLGHMKWASDHPLADALWSDITSTKEDPSSPITVEELKKSFKKVERNQLKKYQAQMKEINELSPEALDIAKLMIGDSRMSQDLATSIIQSNHDVELHGPIRVNSDTLAGEVAVAVEFLKRIEKQVGAWKHHGATAWGNIEAVIKIMETHPDIFSLEMPDSLKARQAEAKQLREMLHGTYGLAEGGISVDHGQLILAKARKAMEESKFPQEASNGGIKAYETFYDVNGHAQSPEWFMESDNFASLGEGHAIFNAFLEEGLENGDIDIMAVRMLRVASAGIDDAFLSSMGFGWKDNIVSHVADREIAASIFGKAFTTTGQVSIEIRKGILGTKGSLGMVDLVLHEIGHGGVETFIRGNPHAWNTAVTLLEGDEGKLIMKNMIQEMHGGKWTAEAQRAYEYFTTAEYGPEEFMAQLFSFTTMARTLSDHTTVSKAFKHDSSNSLMGIIKRIINYVHRKVSNIASVIGTVDPEINSQINYLVDLMAGKTDAIPNAQFTPNEFFMAEEPPTPPSPEGLAIEAQIMVYRDIKENGGTLTAAQENHLEHLTRELARDKARQNNLMPSQETAEEIRTNPQYRDDQGDLYWGAIDGDAAAIQALVVDPIAQQANLPGTGHGSLGIGHFGGGAGKVFNNLIMAKSQWSHTVNSQLESVQAISRLVDHMAHLGTYNPATSEHIQSLEQLKTQVRTKVQKSQIEIQEMKRVAANFDKPVRSRVRKWLIHSGTTKTGAACEKAICEAVAEVTSSNVHPEVNLNAKLAEANIIDPKVVEQAKKAFDEIVALCEEVRNLMVENGTITADAAAKLPGMPLKFDRHRLLADKRSKKKWWGGGRKEEAGTPVSTAAELVLDEITQIAQKALKDSPTVDLLTLRLTGFLPKENASPEELDLWWDQNSEMFPHQDMILALGEERLAFAMQAKFEGLDSPALTTNLDSLRERVRQRSSEVEIRNAGVKALEAKIKRNKISRVDLFGDNVDAANRYDVGITNSHDVDGNSVYVPDAATMLAESHLRSKSKSQQMKEKNQRYRGGTSPAKNAAEAHGYKSFNELQQTGRFLQDSLLVGEKELRASPLLKKYISNDLMDITDGIKKGVLFDELSKKAIYRGIGVRGLTHRELFANMRENMLIHHPHQGETINRAFDFYDQAYGHAAGFRQTLIADGDSIADSLGRVASSFAMLTYGGNLGVAQVAETMQAFADRTRINLSAGGIMKGMSNMFSGLSKAEKVELRRNLSFTMAHIHGEMQTRIDGSKDESLEGRSRFSRMLGKGADMTSRYGGAYMVQRFNKTYCAATGMQLMLRDMDAIVTLSDMLMKEGTHTDLPRFKTLAKEAGFGRRWSDALKWRQLGLLTPELARASRDLMMKSQNKSRKFWSPEKAEQEALSLTGTEAGEHAAIAFDGMMSLLEDYVAKVNVEPRLMDTNLSNSSQAAWHRIMDVYLAWPRAFYAQRIGRGNRHTTAELSSLLAAQYVWDTMYRSLRAMAGGSGIAALIHEWEEDPLGAAMMNVNALPWLGGWTRVAEMGMGISRNFAGKSQWEIPFTDQGIGYIDDSVWRFDVMRSPVGSSLNGMAQVAQGIAKLGESLFFGKADPNDSMLEVAFMFNDIVPGFNSMLAKAAAEEWLQNLNRVRRNPNSTYGGEINRLNNQYNKRKYPYDTSQHTQTHGSAIDQMRELRNQR